MDDDTKPVIIGSLTAKESSILAILLEEGLSLKSQQNKGDQKPMPASASAGSRDQLPRVEVELSSKPLRPTTCSTPSKEDPIKLPKLRIFVKQLSSKDIKEFLSREQNLFTDRDDPSDKPHSLAKADQTTFGMQTSQAAVNTSSPTYTPDMPPLGSSNVIDIPSSTSVDVLDLSIPSNSKIEADIAQVQVLDLSTDETTAPDTVSGMTLHSRANILTPDATPKGLKFPSSTKCEFKIKVIGVKKHKLKYSFKCNVCHKIMHSVKERNSYHRHVHSDIILNCEDCGKGFNVPSSLCDHRYDHRGQAYECETCHLKFTFYSGLQLHLNLLATPQRHACFAGGCAKKYSWPQDIL